MKNFIFVIGICAVIFSLGICACKSKSSTKSGGNVVSEKLFDKKWKLTEINGVALSTMNPQPAVEVFIIFQTGENRVHGNNGCNNFTGKYKIGQGNSLSFSGMASTRMMCIDMTTENQMNKMFQAVDKYVIAGNTLSLNQGETVLAKFVLNE